MKSWGTTTKMPGSSSASSGNHCARFCRPKVAINTLMAVGLSYYVLVLVGAHHRHLQNHQQANEIHHYKKEPLLVNSEIEPNIIRDEKPNDDGFKEPKRILYWTGYYDRKDMVFGFGQDPFIQAGCPVTNCWATANRSDLSRSDVVIFHAGDFNPKDLPEQRLENQRYVYYILETLPNGRGSIFFDPKLTDNYFNWTMSHRRDSDVYIAEPYGAMKRKAGAVVHNQLPPYLSQNERPRLPSELVMGKASQSEKFAKKTKMIAWFCSNTITHGKREDYFKELGKHVQLDVYGKCGNMTCQPRNSPQCNNLLDNYKFYLSAENSLCPDYVTEKFYRALKSGVVPIVYGGADYAQYAPPHSYIHVADFGSPKELAEYLHFLADNMAMYNKYFDWKKEWEVVNNPLDGWCDLCAKLNDPESSKETKIYESISRWWYDDLPCFPGTSFLESVLKKELL